MSGYLTGKTGDRGDRTEFYVPKFYVPFLLPIFGRLVHLQFELLAYS